jgi:hypothetical protein
VGVTRGISGGPARKWPISQRNRDPQSTRNVDIRRVTEPFNYQCRALGKWVPQRGESPFCSIIFLDVIDLDAGPGGHAANLKPCSGYISLVFLGMMRGGPASNVLDKAVQERTLIGPVTWWLFVIFPLSTVAE